MVKEINITAKEDKRAAWRFSPICRSIIRCLTPVSIWYSKILKLIIIRSPKKISSDILWAKKSNDDLSLVELATRYKLNGSVIKKLYIPASLWVIETIAVIGKLILNKFIKVGLVCIFYKSTYDLVGEDYTLDSIRFLFK